MLKEKYQKIVSVAFPNTEVLYLLVNCGFTIKLTAPGGGGYYTYFGYGDVPSGRVSIFTILV